MYVCEIGWIPIALDSCAVSTFLNAVTVIYRCGLTGKKFGNACLSVRRGIQDTTRVDSVVSRQPSAAINRNSQYDHPSASREIWAQPAAACFSGIFPRPSTLKAFVHEWPAAGRGF